MSRKSRHARPSKKKRRKLALSAMAIHKPEVTQPREAAIPAKVSAPSASAPPAVPATQSPYIAAELLRIGILAGTIIVILVVLALVFS